MELDFVEKLIVKLSKGQLKSENKLEDLKKIIGYSFYLDVEHITDTIILKKLRRLYFKLNPDRDILQKIESMESEIERRFYPITQIEYWLGEISMCKVYDTKKDEVLLDLSLNNDEENLSKNLLKYSDLSEMLTNN